MKKHFKLKHIALALLIAVLLPAGSADIFAAPDSEPVRIEMNIGYEKFYKLGYSAPVFFEIENKLRDINGELQVEIPNETDSLTLYAVNISLPANTTKKFTMNVPMNRFLTKLKVNITEGKSTVFTKTFRMDPGASGETFAVGILSDDFESMKYINRVTISSAQNIAAKSVKLSESSFPEDPEGLKMFNAIVINDFDTAKLEGAKYDALKKWVEDGGLLVLGTGPSYSKTLAVFKDDFLVGDIGSVQDLQTGEISRFVGDKTIEAMNVSALDIRIADGTPLLAEGDFTLLQKIGKGKGSIEVAAFDFGMKPLSAWGGNSAFADKAIAAALPPFYSSIYIQKGMIMQSNLYAMDNSVRNIPELPMPKTTQLLLIYSFYILLAAPVSYLVLKRMDRRELMWVTVPALSLLFTAVIYVSGYSTRLTEPVVNIISTVDIDKTGNMTAKTFAGIFTPTKTGIRVEAGEGMRLKPIVMNNYGYYGSGPGTQEDTGKVVESKVVLSPRTAIEFYKSGIWSMKTVVLETEEKRKGSFQSSLNFSRGAFVGTVSNLSGFDLDECYIVTPNQYISIGPIKNGGSKQVNEKPGSYFGNIYDLLNAIYKDPYSGPNSPKKPTAEENRKFRADLQKKQVLEYILMGQGPSEFSTTLIGWSRTPVAKEILVNGKTTKRFEKTVITSNINLSFKDGKNVEYPLGYIKPAIVNNLDAGNYDDYGKAFYGRGNFEVHFKLDSGIQVDSAKIQYNVGSNRTRQFLWNVRKNDWDEGDYRSFNLDGDLIGRYVDKDNTIRLKFEMSDDNVSLPQISLKGSVK